MSTIMLNEAYQEFSHLTGAIIDAPFEQKNATVLKKFICISTDINSLNASKQLLKKIQEIKESLPVEEKSLTIETAQDVLTHTHETLLKINALFDLVKSVFSTGDEEGAEIIIDDNVMLEFLATMEKVKKEMEYVSEYLQLAIKINQSKGEEIKYYNCEEIMILLETA